MTYAEAVQYLLALGNEVQTAKLGLDRIRLLLEALGSPAADGRFIHVAGTNGKGSTSAMIESGIRAAGLRTGLYTSPHLVSPTERIRIQGEPISEELFTSAFEAVHSAAERLIRDEILEFHPTYFETVTAMAFLVFHDAALDWVVLETGLGGRLDATNVVNPQLCVITPIALDHQNLLGKTIRLIAGEKAGILKPGAPAVIAPQLPEAAEVLGAAASGPLIHAEDWLIEGLSITERGSRFRIDGREVVCPLAGEHQVQNARVAALALRQIGLSADGIARASWPGRLQHVSENPETIVDGAHNPAGAHALAAYIARFYGGREVWLVYGSMRDKPAVEMGEILFPLASRIILTAAANSRALDPRQISAPGAIVTQSVADALEAVRQAPASAVVLITGSLFIAGEALALLRLQ